VGNYSHVAAPNTKVEINYNIRTNLDPSADYSFNVSMNSHRASSQKHDRCH